MNDQKPTLKEAMQATMIWCKSWENDEISDEVISDRIGELIKTVEGARGFFVVSLSIDCPLMDRLPDALIFQLRSSGEMVVDLTVKNLAMSSAMVIKHKDNKNPLENQSNRIKIRCIELLKLLDSTQVKKRLDVLIDAIKGNGKDFEFLNKWSYDEKQISEILKSINEIAT